MGGNFIPFTLKANGRERFLHIGLDLFHLDETPPVLDLTKRVVYEGLMKILSPNQNDFGKGLFQRSGPTFTIALGDLQQAFLGYMKQESIEGAPWKWDGDTTKLDSDEIEKLEAFMNNRPEEGE